MSYLDDVDTCMKKGTVAANDEEERWGAGVEYHFQEI